MNMKETIYFDIDDHDADGNGWNVVEDGGAIALRFATKEQAIDWCERHSVTYELIHGECDCTAVYVLGGDDHCGEEGTCWDCCTCS